MSGSRCASRRAAGRRAGALGAAPRRRGPVKSTLIGVAPADHRSRGPPARVRHTGWYPPRGGRAHGQGGASCCGSGTHLSGRRPVVVGAECHHGVIVRCVVVTLKVVVSVGVLEQTTMRLGMGKSLPCLPGLEDPSRQQLLQGSACQRWGLRVWQVDRQCCRRDVAVDRPEHPNQRTGRAIDRHGQHQYPQH